jgi:hypothetical protein
MILPRAIRRAGGTRPISTHRRLRHTRCREVRRFLGLSVRQLAAQAGEVVGDQHPDVRPVGALADGGTPRPVCSICHRPLCLCSGAATSAGCGAG